MAYRLLEILSLGGLNEAILLNMETKSVVPGERDLKNARLKFIAALLFDGLFNRCEWGVCHCKEDGKDYRVNGQHSAHQLRRVLNGELESKVFPEGVPVTLTKYECDNKRDLIDVFDQFDQHQSSRSADDKLGIYMAQYQDLAGIDKKLVSKVLTGVDFGRKLKVESILDALGDVDVPESHERGRMLKSDQVRDFIDLMHDNEDVPFKLWENKAGIVARLFLVFLDDDADQARNLIDAILNLATDSAKAFVEEMMRADSRKGKEAGWYYRKTDKCVKGLAKEYVQVGSDEFEKRIRAIIDEVKEESEEDKKAVALAV